MVNHVNGIINMMQPLGFICSVIKVSGSRWRCILQKKNKLKRSSNRTVLLICLLHVHLLTRFVIGNAL